MIPITSKKSKLFRFIATGLLCLVILNDISFALQSKTGRENSDTLAPTSRFNPIVRIEEKDEGYVIVEDEKERAKLQPTDTFQKDIAFMYLSHLIGQVLARFGGQISAEVLKELIEKHLSHLDFVKSGSRFKWQRLYKEGDTFCLPYVRKKGGEQVLRYYLPEDKTEESPEEDETSKFPEEVEIPLGIDGLKVILEDPRRDETDEHKPDEVEVSRPREKAAEASLTLDIPSLHKGELTLMAQKDIAKPIFDKVSGIIVVPEDLLSVKRSDDGSIDVEGTIFENKSLFTWIIKALLQEESIPEASIERLAQVFWCNRKSLVSGHRTLRQIVSIYKTGALKIRLGNVGRKSRSSVNRTLETWDDLLLLLELSETPIVSTIYVDFDDTLFKPATYIGSEQWVRDRLSEGDNIRQIIAEKNYYDAQLLEAKLIREMESGLAERLNNLRNRGVKIVGLTARSPSSQPLTQMVLDDLGFKMDEVIYISNSRNKYHILQRQLKEQEELQKRSQDQTGIVSNLYSVYIDDSINSVIRTENQRSKLFDEYRLVGVSYRRERLDTDAEYYVEQAQESMRHGYNKAAIMHFISALESIMIDPREDLLDNFKLVLSIDKRAESLDERGEDISELTASWIRCASFLLKEYSHQEILSLRDDEEKTGQEVVRRYFSKIASNPETFYEFYKNGKIQIKDSPVTRDSRFRSLNIEINENNLYCFMEPLLQYLESNRPDVIILPDTGARPFRDTLEYFIKEKGLPTKVLLLPFSGSSTADTAFEMDRWLAIANKKRNELADDEDRAIHDALAHFARTEMEGKKGVIFDDNISSGNTASVVGRILQSRLGMRSTKKEGVGILAPFSFQSPGEADIPSLATVSLPVSAGWRGGYFTRFPPVVALTSWEKDYAKRGVSPRERYSPPRIDATRDNAFLGTLLDNFKMHTRKYYMTAKKPRSLVQAKARKDTMKSIDDIYKETKPCPSSTLLPEQMELGDDYRLRQVRDLDGLKRYYQDYLENDLFLDELSYPDFSGYEIRKGEELIGIISFLDVIDEENNPCLLMRKISVLDLSESETSDILERVFHGIIQAAENKKYHMVLINASKSKSTDSSTSHKVRRWLRDVFGQNPHLFSRLRLKETSGEALGPSATERIKRIISNLMPFERISDKIEELSLDRMPSLLNFRFHKELTYRPNILWCSLTAEEREKLEDIKGFFAPDYADLIHYAYGREKMVIRRWKSLFLSAGGDIPNVPIRSADYHTVMEVADRAKRLTKPIAPIAGGMKVEEIAVRLYQSILLLNEEIEESGEEEPVEEALEQIEDEELSEAETEEVLMRFPAGYFTGKRGSRRGRAVVLYALENFHGGHDLSGLRKRFFRDHYLQQALRECYHNSLMELAEDISPGNYKKHNGSLIRTGVMEIPVQQFQERIHDENRFLICPGQHCEVNIKDLPDSVRSLISAVLIKDAERIRFEFRDDINHGYICEVTKLVKGRKEPVDILYCDEETQEIKSLRGKRRRYISLEEWDIYDFLSGRDIKLREEGTELLLPVPVYPDGKIRLYHGGEVISLKVAGPGEHTGSYPRLRFFEDPNHGIMMEISVDGEVTNHYFRDEDTGEVGHLGIIGRRGKIMNLAQFDIYSFLNGKDILPIEGRDTFASDNIVSSTGAVSFPGAGILLACSSTREKDFKGQNPTYRLFAGPNKKTMVEISINGEVTNYYYQDPETGKPRHFLEQAKNLRRGYLMSLQEFNIMSFLKSEDVQGPSRVGWDGRIDRHGSIRFPEIGKLHVCRAGEYVGEKPGLELLEYPNHGTMLFCHVMDKDRGEKIVTNYYLRNKRTGRVESWLTEKVKRPLPSLAGLDVVSFLQGEDVTPLEGRDEFIFEARIYGSGDTSFAGIDIKACAKNDEGKIGDREIKARLFADPNHGTMLEISVRDGVTGEFEVGNYYFKDKKTGQIKSFRELQRSREMISFAEFDVISFLSGQDIDVLEGRDVLKKVKKVGPGGSISLVRFPRGIKVCPRGEHKGDPVDLTLFKDPNHGVMLECSINGEVLNYYYKDKTTGKICHLRKKAGLTDVSISLAEMDLNSFFRGEDVKPQKGREVIEKELTVSQDGRVSKGMGRMKICRNKAYIGKHTVRFHLIYDENLGTVVEISVKDRKTGSYEVTNYYYKDSESGEIRYFLPVTRDKDVHRSLGELDVLYFMKGRDIKPVEGREEIIYPRPIDKQGLIKIQHYGVLGIPVSREGEHVGKFPKFRFFHDPNHGTMLECFVGEGKAKEVTNIFYKDKITGRIRSLLVKSGIHGRRIIGLGELDVISFLRGQKIIPQEGREEVVSVGYVHPGGSVSLPVIGDVSISPRVKKDKQKGKFRFFTDPVHGAMLECSVEGKITDYYYRDKETGEVRHFREWATGKNPDIVTFPEFDILCCLTGKDITILPERNIRVRTRHKIVRGSFKFFEAERILIGAKYNGQYIDLQLFDHPDRGMAVRCYAGDEGIGHIYYDREEDKPIFVPKADGFIRSEGGFAPEKLAKIMFEEREKLKPAEITDFERIQEYIRSKISELEQKAAQAETQWQADNLPEFAEIAKRALERIRSVDILSFSAIVYKKEDYALGYGDEYLNEIGLSEELLDMDMELLAEYIFHETVCVEVTHEKARTIQRYLFTDNYFEDEFGRSVSKLKLVLRELIDRSARIVNGIDYLEVLKEALGDMREEVALVLTDESDDPERYFGRYGGKSSWEERLNMLGRSDRTYVFYGQLSAVFHTGDIFDTLNEDIKSKKHFKVFLDKEHGLAGVYDVPEELNEKIRDIMKETEGSLLVDVIPFTTLTRLYAAGYEPAIDVLRNFMLDKSPLCSYEEFDGIMEVLARRRKHLEREYDWKEWFREYFRVRGPGYEFSDVRRFCGMLEPETLRSYVRRYLLRTDIDVEDKLAIMEELFETRGPYRRTEVEDLLWDVYLDERNASEENALFLKLLMTRLNSHEVDNADTIFRISGVFKGGDVNRTHKAIDVLLRLKLTKEDTRPLLTLLDDARYKKEIVAAFCLLNITLFGTREMPVVRDIFRRESAGPIGRMMSPEVRNIYYYLLKSEEARRRGGTLKSDVDDRILRYTIALDEKSAAPGEAGWTWFSTLRSQTHKNASSDDLVAVRNALHYWKELDENIILRARDSLSRSLNTRIGEETTETYSTMLNNALKLLHESGRPVSLEGGRFLSDIIDNLREDEVVQAVYRANPEEDEYDLEKMENMILLYYALSERYGVVGAAVVSHIKGETGPERRRADRKEEMLRMVEFMGEEYGQLMSVIDGDDHKAILSAIANCRAAIRHHLLFGRTESSIEKDRLMELDYNMFLHGKDMLVHALNDINRCEKTEDLKEHIDAIVSMGRFMQASGLGGVDFEQFIDELEHGHLKYSQLHDLTRAMRAEMHKAGRKINESMRFAMEHIWDTLDPYELTDDWKGRIESERKRNRFGHMENVISEQSRRTAEDTIVDDLIRDTGILSFDEALTKFNDILETQLTPETDKYIDGVEETGEVVLEDQFFRFGQPEVIPRDRLLSLWSKKGLNLVIMTEEGLKVPPGVIVSARLITRPEIYKSPEFQEKVGKEIELIRKEAKYPDLKLLFYARSGSAFMLPGLLVTINNLGMNREAAKELETETGDKWFAYDTYAEFIRTYAIHILGIPEEYFDEALNVYEKDRLTGDDMERVCDKYLEIVDIHGKGQKIPDTMIEQMMMAIDAVYASWDCKEARDYRARHKISQEWGTVVILQKGVFGNLNPTEDGKISGTGWGVLKILPDGREVVQGKFRFRAIGQELMSRPANNYVLLSNSERRNEDEDTLEDMHPEFYREILDRAHKLKEIFVNNQRFEFTVELNELWLTQSNDDIVTDGYPEFVDTDEMEPIARGHGVSGGALRGWVANSFDEAEELREKYNREKPADVDGVILFLERVNPDMINRIPPGVNIVARIISVHAETLAQKYGITAVYGVPDMRFDDEEKVWFIGEHKMECGRTISIDGHENQLLYHNSGKIFLGSLPLAEQADGRIEIERRTPRALDMIRELRAEERRREAIAAAPGLTEYERNEVLPLFRRFAAGEIHRGELQRFHMNLRAILDKIAQHCKDLDFEKHGEEFRRDLTEKLAELGISCELFMELEHYYNADSRDSREILRNIVFRLNYEPPEKVEPEEVTLYNREGEQVVVTKTDVYEGKLEGGYYIVHRAERDVKLVSFEMDGVLEHVLRTEGLEKLLTLFRSLKSLGLMVAINTTNPGVLRWMEHIRSAYPEIDACVDYCYDDGFLGVHLQRYVDELGLEPDQIMFFGNAFGRGLSFGDHSAVADFHERGFVGVMVDRREGILHAADIMERRVDAVMYDVNISDILDLVKHWINVSPAEDPDPRGENSRKARKGVQDFLSAVRVCAFEKKQREDIIVGIDTSWIPEAQMPHLQGVLNELTRISRKRGLGNISFVRGKGEDLAGELLKEKEEQEVPLSNIVILGEYGVLDSAAFNPLRGTIGKDDGAFFANVMVPGDFTENNYIALFDMLTKAMKLAFGEVTRLYSPFMDIVKRDNRTFIFIPRALPMDPEELKETYDNQRDLIVAA